MARESTLLQVSEIRQIVGRELNRQLRLRFSLMQLAISIAKLTIST